VEANPMVELESWHRPKHNGSPQGKTENAENVQGKNLFVAYAANSATSTLFVCFREKFCLSV
jgi:hypothetical protein